MATKKWQSTQTALSALSIETLLIKKQQINRLNIQKLVIVFIVITIFVLMCAGVLYYFYVLNNTNRESNEKIVGLDGLWPVWGGNIENQQHSPDDNTIITIENIKTIQKQCYYNVTGTSFLKGYITIDETGDYGYFAELTGYITAINLDSCKLKWRININQILNITSPHLKSTNGLTLYRNSAGIKGVLVSPENMDENINMSYSFVFALNRNNGSLLWKLKLFPSDGGGNSPYTKLHGFIVDDHYGYIGMASHSRCLCKFRGRMIKIDINNGTLVSIWYTLPEYNNNENVYDYYSGAAVWGYGAIIDDYLVFGSGNLYEIPNDIEQCILYNNSNNNHNIFIPLDNYPFNMCGENMSNIYPHWKCYDKNIHSDSLNILNKTTMKLIKSIPMAGVDIFKVFCNLWSNQIDTNLCRNKLALGSDSDLVAIALYRDINNNPFSVVVSKGGMFMIVSLKTGKIKVVRKIGPSGYGGGSLYSLAVDQKSMIAIVSITAHTSIGPAVRYKDINDRYICHAGSNYAINLNTGNILWQSVNPYGLFDEKCLNNTKYDNYTDWYVDRYGICQFGINETKRYNVIYANLSNDDFLPLYSVEKSVQISPVTITNNMVFIPNLNGDIFIHNLFDGSIIYRIQCDDYFDVNSQQWTRPGILSGVTVIKTRIVFYCGGLWYADKRWYSDYIGNKLISMTL